MATYQAPLRFMRFLLHEVFNTEETLKKLNIMEDFNVELMDAILDEAAMEAIKRTKFSPAKQRARAENEWI